MTKFRLEDFLYKSNIIQPLKGFCNTIQEGSINKAAKKMGLTQSTVTRQVLALERELGVKLFDRSGKSVVPTKIGIEFYKMAIVQLQGMESLFGNFYKKMQADNKNTLNIAGYYSALSYILPKYIKLMSKQEEFKNVKIKLCNINKQEAFRRLIDNQIDFMFYPSVKDDKVPVEIQKENLFKLKNAIFVHKSHPLANKRKKLDREDIEKYPFLLRDRYEFFDPTKSINFKASNVELENGNSHIVLGFIKENYAMGICGELYANENKLAGHEIVFKNIDHLLPKMFYSLFTLKNKANKNSALFIFDKLRQDSDLKTN